MKACVFCDIANNKQLEKIYESEEVVAIFDKSQEFLGHILVLPKKHYDNLLLVPKAIYSKLLNITVTIAKIEKDIFKASGINIVTNIGKDVGQTVMHCHIHIIPHNIKKDQLIKKQINKKYHDIYEKILFFIKKNRSNSQ